MLTLVAVVGVITALFAATVACAQDDIKRVLAYSTISQLGYMFLAVGSGAYVASIFHMVTHAFFKALLFLGAGAVIHGLHEEQDMKRMGALRRYMPVTAVTFLVGWLAISGIPPFAGFWSKDDILAAAYHKSAPLWALAALTAGLTAYYMSRQVALVFFGSSRWGQGAGGHGGAGHAASGPPHEAPWTMAAPLVVLGALSVVGGAVNLPLRGWEHLERFLAPVVALAHVTETPVATGTKWALFAVTLAVVAVGVSAGLGLWSRRPEHPRLEPVVLEDAWGVDALYSAAFGSGGAFVAAEAAALDSVVIDGTVNGVGTAVRRAGSQLRRLQTGYVRNYALGIAAGAALVLGYVVVRAGG